MAHLAIAITGLRSAAVLLSACHDCHCHCWIAFWLCCCYSVPVALGGKDIMMTKMLIEDVSTLLMVMTIEDC